MINEYLKAIDTIKAKYPEANTHALRTNDYGKDLDTIKSDSCMLEAFERCCCYIQEEVIDKGLTIKSINKERTSYGYKHTVEHWQKYTGKEYLYIPNIAFVLAAFHMGLNMTYEYNPQFNISKRAHNWYSLPRNDKN
ncbi:TPA: hypothetical protein ACOJP0_001330 [Vibrio harveyi]|uniref:hypothetical protein n=1 Tax=Vibrio harveyi TaxID=669 RepID=UPI0039098CB2